MDVAHDESDRGFFARLGLASAVSASPRRRCAVGRGFQCSFKAVDPKLSPASREVGLGYLLDSGISHPSIISCSSGWRCSGVTTNASEQHRRRLARRQKSGPPKVASSIHCLIASVHGLRRNVLRHRRRAIRHRLRRESCGPRRGSRLQNCPRSAGPRIPCCVPNTLGWSRSCG